MQADGMSSRAALLALALAGACAVVAGVAWQVGGSSGSGGQSSPRGQPAVTAAAAGATAAPVRLVEGPAVAVLADWDRRRAAAYSAGDPVRLRGLYLPSSRAGAADVTVLRRYAARGLRVRRLRTQVLEAEVLGRRPGRLVLRVTERLAGAVAVGRGVRVRLPEDRASRHTVTLVRRAGRWVVARTR